MQALLMAKCLEIRAMHSHGREGWSTVIGLAQGASWRERGRRLLDRWGRESAEG